MSTRRIITKYGGRQVLAVFSENLLTDFQILPQEEQMQVGDIYMCRVKNVVKNIRAAFVEIGKGDNAYLSLQEKEPPVYGAGGKMRENGGICQGELLLVQMAKEAQKSKPPTVTTRLDIPGKYVVLTHGRCQTAVSSKISDAGERERLCGILKEYENDSYGFIARTCSQNVSVERLRKDIETLQETYAQIIKTGSHAVQGQKIYSALPVYVQQIQNRYGELEDAVVTDIPEVYETLKTYFSENEPQFAERLSLHTDAYPLIKLHSLETQIEKLLREKVWLKSGGFLVIQPTEALVSVDVNTGKAVSGKKSTEDTYFHINMEAATEIARQLRLRNLSGIILVDFIDMKEESHRQELLGALKKELQKDSVKTVLVDMTKLGLVEITRKKLRSPIHEVFRSVPGIFAKNV